MRITPRSLQALLAAAVALAPLTAAAQSGPSEAPPASTATTVQHWTDQDYRLGNGDRLRIEVYGETQLSQSVQIRPDGKITLPLVGDIEAVGRTSIELRDSVSESLREYVTNPVVTVIVQEVTAPQVYVIGEVASPGAQTLRGPLTVLQALAQAGGLREFANQRNIRILRTTDNGTQTIRFNYRDAVQGRTDPMPLQPGDTLVVP